MTEKEIKETQMDAGIKLLKKYCKEKNIELQKEQEHKTCDFTYAYWLGYNHALELVCTMFGQNYDEIIKENK